MLCLSSTFLNYFLAAFQVKAALPAFRLAAVVRQLAYNTTPIAFCQLLFQTFFKNFNLQFKWHKPLAVFCPSYTHIYYIFSGGFENGLRNPWY